MVTTAKIPPGKLGVPGIAGHFVALDVLQGDQRADLDRINDKSERKFLISGILSKSALLDVDIELSVDVKRGGSYVLAHPETVYSLIKTPLGSFTLDHNSKRELAKVTFECTATSRSTALATFQTAIGPVLDHISYVANVPLHTTRTECIDSKNNIRSYNYVTPHLRVTLNPHEAKIYDRVIPLYGLYREAKNATSPFYKFLCYYKIIEGTYLHVRRDYFETAKTMGINPIKEKEVVPDHPELRYSHPDLVGKPIKAIFDERFTPEFRDEVAHYLLSGGAVLKVSDFATINRFESEILIIELCARTVISVQERYEAQLA